MHDGVFKRRVPPVSCDVANAQPEDMVVLRFASLLGAAALLLAWIAPAYSSQVVDRIVAVVNGQIITLSELDDNTMPMLERMQAQGYSLLEQEQALPEIRRQILDKMVNDILLVQEAESLGLEVSEVEVEAYINQFKTENSLTEDMLLAQLQYEGLTRTEYEARVRDTMLRTRLLQLMVRRKVVVTNQDVEEYFQEHMDEYASDMSINVSVLVMQDLDELRTVREQVQEGDVTFADAVRANSVGPDAENGGAMGDFRVRDLSDDWKEAVAGLQAGDVSEPLAVDGRFALLYVNSVDIRGDVTLADVQEEIFQTIEDARLNELLVDYLDELKGKAIIDIRL